MSRKKMNPDGLTEKDLEDLSGVTVHLTDDLNSGLLTFKQVLDHITAAFEDLPRRQRARRKPKFKVEVGRRLTAESFNRLCNHPHRHNRKLNPHHVAEILLARFKFFMTKEQVKAHLVEKFNVVVTDRNLRNILEGTRWTDVLPTVKRVARRKTRLSPELVVQARRMHSEAHVPESVIGRLIPEMALLSWQQVWRICHGLRWKKAGGPVTNAVPKRGAMRWNEVVDWLGGPVAVRVKGKPAKALPWPPGQKVPWAACGAGPSPLSFPSLTGSCGRARLKHWLANGFLRKAW